MRISFLMVSINFLLKSEIGAEEAEEVGVEHLLRDIKDTTVGTLSQKVTNQVMGLKGLHGKLDDMNNYVQQVRVSPEETF